MTAPRFVLRASDEGIVVLDPPPKVRRAIAEEAAFRGMRTEVLVEKLLSAIADGDEFSNLLDGRGPF